MPRREILDRIQKYIQPFRITKGESFQLKNYDPGDTCGLKLDKGDASELLREGTEWLAQEQDMLYAQDRWSVLLVFQAMDAVEQLDLKYPKVDAEKKKELATVRAALARES